jgi:hypothetical protein
LTTPGTRKTGLKGTFHHLIALFCTVAGKAGHARGHATIFCNEIKDLEAFQEEEKRQNPLSNKHLERPMQVIPEGRTGAHAGWQSARAGREAAGSAAAWQHKATQSSARQRKAAQ